MAFAVATYLLLLAVLAYAIGFFADLPVPKGIDGGTAAPAPVAVAIDLLFLLLFVATTTTTAPDYEFEATEAARQEEASDCTPFHRNRPRPRCFEATDTTGGST